MSSEDVVSMEVTLELVTDPDAVVVSSKHAVTWKVAEESRPRRWPC
jgi:hypothetical protein